MDTLKIARRTGLAFAMAVIPAALQAQTPAPAPVAGQAPGQAPGLAKPMPSDSDTAAPKAGAAAPSAPAAAATSAATVSNVTVGTPVFGSDGQKIGEVKGVKSQPGGAVEEIHVKTGGILGFGGKVVVIPAAKISKGGQTIQIVMTADEVGKLPALAEKKG